MTEAASSLLHGRTVALTDQGAWYGAGCPPAMPILRPMPYSLYLHYTIRILNDLLYEYTSYRRKRVFSNTSMVVR